MGSKITRWRGDVKEREAGDKVQGVQRLGHKITRRRGDVKEAGGRGGSGEEGGGRRGREDERRGGGRGSLKAEPSTIGLRNNTNSFFFCESSDATSRHTS